MSGHGHVIPNADGSKARCGGPGLCSQCTFESFNPKLAQKMAEQPTFTCPVCKAVSHNPNDVEQGYCGRCHIFTGGKP